MNLKSILARRSHFKVWVSLSVLCGLVIWSSSFGTSAGAREQISDIHSNSETDSVRMISLTTNDIVYNPTDGKLYASLPSSAGSNGNSIVSVDPMTGMIGPSVWVGSEPSKLALANDGQNLYVYLSGAYAIRKYNFLNQTPGTRFSLGQESFFGLYQASDFAVAPDNPDLVAVARYYLGTSPPQGGAAVFQNGVQLSQTGPGHSEGAHFLTFGASGSTLYGSNDYGLKTMSVNGNGLTVQNGTVSAGAYARLKFENGLAFTSNGQMIDAGAGMLLGTFPNASSQAFVPDTSVGRAYYLVQTGQNTLTLKAYSLSTFTEIGALVIPGVQGTATSLVRWGTNGLAFRTSTNQLFLLQTSLIPTSNPLPLPPPVSTPTPTPTPAYLPTFIRRVSVPGNDVVYSSQSNSVLISVPGAAGGGIGNTITHVDPTNGQITGSYFIGSEPKRLALADNGVDLYAVLSGANAIRRYNAATQTPGLQFATSSLFFNPSDMAVMPGNANILAVTTGYEGVGIFDNGVQRPVISDGGAYAINTIAFSDAPNILYGYDYQSSGHELVKFTVTAQGVGGTMIGNSILSGNSTQIKYSDGLLYGTTGRVVNPETKAVSGTFQGSGSVIAIDAALNRVYFMYQNTLSVFELSTFLKLGSVTLPFSGTPTSLVRWGENGLVFRTMDNNVYLLQSAFVSSSGTVPTGTAMNAANYSVSESSATATVAVVRTGDLSRASTIDYSTQNGSALAGLDYVSQSGTLNFAAGEASKNIIISLIDDNAYEGNESFSVTLSNPTDNNVQLLAPTTSSVTIFSNDNRPTIAATNVTVGEPLIGMNGLAEVPVQLSNPSSEVITFNYSTANGSAIAGSDYISVSGTVTFSPSETAKTIAVELIADSIPEANETFFVNISNPTNSTIVQSQASVSITNSSRRAFDYDGDGKTDMSVWRIPTGTWYVARSGLNDMYVQPWGFAGDVIVPADYDGDGKTDLAVRRPSDDNFYVFNSSNSTVEVRNFGLAGDVAVPSDYNGDGKADVAVWRPSNGTWYLSLSGSGIFYVMPWGLSTDRPVPGDYDGDGKTELAVFRPADGSWQTFNTVTGTISVTGWGIDGDRPVQGDYNGDGRADFAVYRPSNNTWFVQNSNDGAVSSTQWGLPEDFPVPGDYDGDGKTDVAVWRPSDATWYVNRSGSGILTQTFGMNGDTPTPSAFVF